MTRRLALLIGLAALSLLGLAPSASAAPAFKLDIHHNQTNFAPGGAPGTIITDTVTDGAAPATDEVQRIHRIWATAGAYTLTFDGATTPDLPFDATAAEVEVALEALPSIGAGNVSVTVTGAGDPHYEIAFTGALAAADLPQIAAADGDPRLSIAPEYWFDVTNVGDAPTAGPITLRISLPSGLTREAVLTGQQGVVGGVDWSCPGSPGQTTVVCTTNDPIPRHTINLNLRLAVTVAPGASGVRFTAARVSGGGAPAPASALELTRLELGDAAFGIVPESFTPGFLAADEVTPILKAGAHPDLFVVPFDFNSRTAPPSALQNPRRKIPVGTVRDLRVDLPPGFLGDPTAVDECTPSQLALAQCPPSSQVGRLDLRFGGTGFGSNETEWIPLHAGVFNMTHPRGSVADLAFSIGANPVHIRASLDPARNYSIATTVSEINETLPSLLQRLTLWGVPADPSHDSERCPRFVEPDIVSGAGDTSQECSAGAPRKPFLTVPFQCDSDMQLTLSRYDSWQNPGVFGPDLIADLGQFTGCEAPQAEFDPDVAIVPTNTRADSPTGLNVTASVPQNTNPDRVATPPVKRIEVKLPQGMAVNPSFADGLNGCSEAEIGISHSGVPDTNKVTCPDASRIGAVELSTPLLPTPSSPPPDCPGGASLQGSIYLAKQNANPVNSLFAFYTVIHDCEDRGVLVKIPGRLDLDPNTGQVTTTFDELPQFPFDALSVQFRGGDRAPLVNPPTCGTKTIEGTLNTWSEPGTDVAVDSNYTITEGPSGGPCSADLRSRPFNPAMRAGTQDPVAGRYSPFVLKLTRQDGEQEMTGLEADLPPGLAAKFAGIEQCPDSVLRSIPTAPGTGAAEKASPSCPANSRVGHVNAGSGAGPQPFYIGGSVYLAGPYKGAPLSVAVVTPAVAGGIDLGNVVIRTALHIDSDDAQAHAVSDPLPTILHGVPIHLRDVRVVMDRDQFILNPTSCDEKPVTGKATGAGASLTDPADDTSAALSDRFQVSGCAELGFKPRLTLRLRGGTRRGAHPALSATLTPRPGDANIASVSVAFPKSEFLENAHIRTVCTRPDFAASACPAGAIYGQATATSPLFDFPLEANVYLRSSSNLLPDVVPDFRGPATLPIRIESAGRVDSIRGGIRNTFDFIPDAPITRVVFALQGGKKGLLVNSRDICRHAYRATVRFTAHNGDSITRRTKLQANCRKARKGKKRKGKRGGHRRSGDRR